MRFLCFPQFFIYIFVQHYLQSAFCNKNGVVVLANIFCWAAALLYAQMGAKSVVICPIPYKHSSFPDIPFGMPDFKLFCFQPLKSMLSLMKKDDSPFFRSESCNEAY